ncbi:unnamed protein product [Symbiodinium sp. CCMP2592]|nr:unnamed protein product [Symbiodinium sp. CCMP2592]
MTIMLPNGLVRMPVEPDGWVTVHARHINGPTFLSEAQNEGPVPRGPGRGAVVRDGGNQTMPPPPPPTREKAQAPDYLRYLYQKEDLLRYRSLVQEVPEEIRSFRAIVVPNFGGKAGRERKTRDRENRESQQEDDDEGRPSRAPPPPPREREQREVPSAPPVRAATKEPPEEKKTGEAKVVLFGVGMLLKSSVESQKRCHEGQSARGSAPRSEVNSSPVKAEETRDDLGTVAGPISTLQGLADRLGSVCLDVQSSVFRSLQVSHARSDFHV